MTQSAFRKPDQKLIFGPVPSRRLGRSVGINNIPPKVCTYSCVYCQLGKSAPAPPQRRAFYDPDMILEQTRAKLAHARASGEPVDYLTIVSDGEPTLDKNLGRLIGCLRPLGIKIAVITNASLLSLPDVRENLGQADWVSVKVDALDEKIWRRTDRPHPTIRFTDILEGITLFSKTFRGTLVTETMLVEGINHKKAGLEATADFIKNLDPCLSYLGIPTRPPALKSVRPPEESEINKAWQIFTGRGLETEYLIGYEGNQFAYTGDVETDILSITAVHPMREEAVRAYLKKADGAFTCIEQLVMDGKLLVSEYGGERFYLRPLAR
ncbi:MAG: radical SAM protein [Desulfobacter sp.]|nr:MAG: radical SAM protein [Desulfobacter sp.]